MSTDNRDVLEVLKAELNFVETEFFLEFREHREDGLAIRVVEQAHEPQHRYDRPLVGA